MSKAVATLTMLLFVLVLAPAAGFAQSNGSIYQTTGINVPIYFNFSVSGPTFVVTILAYGAKGNGRWFAGFGTTDGVNATGKILLPSGFVTEPLDGGSVTFTFDQPNGLVGNFTVLGLEGLLTDRERDITSGRFVRIFP